MEGRVAYFLFTVSSHSMLSHFILRKKLTISLSSFVASSLSVGLASFST